MPFSIQSRPSPHFNERKNVPVQYVVLHYTGMMSAEGWLAAVRDPKTELSAHYLIDEEGTVTQVVPESKRAWHAGQSFWRGVTDMNSASIGIELANPGHDNDYRPFPEAQTAALWELLRYIVARHRMNPALAIVGHSDIAPRRKRDPGELFSWRDLARGGMGLWPEPMPEDYGAYDADEVKKNLRAIGYDCPFGEDDEPAYRAALLAFQRHYHPENLSGAPEEETVARLRALARAVGKLTAKE